MKRFQGDEFRHLVARGEALNGLGAGARALAAGARNCLGVVTPRGNGVLVRGKVT